MGINKGFLPATAREVPLYKVSNEIATCKYPPRVPTGIKLKNADMESQNKARIN